MCMRRDWDKRGVTDKIVEATRSLAIDSVDSLQVGLMQVTITFYMTSLRANLYFLSSACSGSHIDPGE